MDNFIKITEQIHLIKYPFTIPIAPDKTMERFVFSLIVFGEKITLIDTGVKESEKRIFDCIVENGRRVEEIETIILSHSHPDHIGSAATIKEKTHCLIYAHIAEKNWFENITLQNAERPVPGFFSLVDTPIQIDSYIDDGDYLNLGEGLNLKIIHTPGHSKGSISLLFEKQRILFTADAIPLSGDIPNYDNYFDLIKSLYTIHKIINSEADTLISSWADPLYNKLQIAEAILKGTSYLDKLENAIQKYYPASDASNFDNCKNLINGLNMPQSYINLIVHKAFISHLK
jgi:glyoxylase-like metal-dependent hydrolase (beta-lactamase superfamily II)